MNISSIYGPQVSPTEAAQWLKNNPRAARSSGLKKVADYDANGKVDHLELSQAANNKVLILDGIHSFKLTNTESYQDQYYKNEVAKQKADATVGAVVVGTGLAVGAGWLLFEAISGGR